MNYILGENIKVGQKIKWNGKWYKVESKDENGVFLGKALMKINFGESIEGWKFK